MKKVIALNLLAGLAVLTASAAPAAGTDEKSRPASRVALETPTIAPRFKAPGKISVAKGEQVYVEYCAVCHGMHGKGDGPRSAFFSETQYIPDLTTEGFVAGREEDVLEGIREGLRRLDEPLLVMPQFKYILSENDIRSVLAYVKTLPGPTEKPTRSAKKKK